MSEVIDLTGMTFGRWLVVRRASSNNGYATWWCQCDCGSACQVRGSSLRSGRTRSCGCARYLKQQSDATSAMTPGKASPRRRWRASTRSGLLR
jgi:hypothetical protein